MPAALAIAVGVHALVGIALVRPRPAVERVVEVTPEVTLRPEEPAPEASGSEAAPGKPRRKMVANAVARANPQASADEVEIESQAEGDHAIASGGGGGAGSGTSVSDGRAPSAASGSGSGAGAAPAPSVDRAKLLGEALAKIRAARHYPELARRRGLEGVVTVGFRVLPDGTVTDLRVRRAAAPALDEAALDAVRRAAPLPIPLAGGALEVDLDFHLTD